MVLAVLPFALFGLFGMSLYPLLASDTSLHNYFHRAAKAISLGCKTRLTRFSCGKSERMQSQASKIMAPVGEILSGWYSVDSGKSVDIGVPIVDIKD